MMISRIGKLWRGELGLAESFWLWGVIGLVALSFSSQFLVMRLIVGGYLSGFLFISYVLIAVGMGYLVLVSVGIWRSAAKYAGLRLWSWGSRGVVTATLLLNVYMIGLMALHSPADISDPGKSSCNIEDFLKPSSEYPLVGFWKQSCSEDFGLAVDARKDGLYSVSFCGPGGCFKPESYRPHTRFIDDKDYKVVDQNTIEVRGMDGFSRYRRCTKPFSMAAATSKSDSAPHADAQKNPAASAKACRQAS